MEFGIVTQARYPSAGYRREQSAVAVIKKQYTLISTAEFSHYLLILRRYPNLPPNILITCTNYHIT
jgi:hypothetical protein